MCTRGWVPSPCGHFRLFAHQLNVPTCFDYKFGISKQLVSLASSFQTQGSSFTWSFLYHTSLVHTLNSAFCFSIWLALARNLMSKLHSLRTRCFLLPIASPLYVSLSLCLSPMKSKTPSSPLTTVLRMFLGPTLVIQEK